MSTELVPIRAACAMYGVNPNTLRAWERRYGIIAPARGEGGQRGFGPADLDRIRQMVELTRGGMAPSAAAEQIKGQRISAASKTNPKIAQLRARFSREVEHLNAEELHRICNDAEAALGYQPAVENVLFPELAVLGERWHSNPGTIAQEHCASMAVRGFLTQRYLGSTYIRQLSSKQQLPLVTLACVPDELHDLPIFHLANVLLETRQIRPAVLAAGLPLSESLAASEHLSAALLLLSATMRPTAAQVREWTDEIVEAGWEERCVLAGSGFRDTRIFSETKVRAAAGTYAQVAGLIVSLAAPADAAD